VGVRVLCGPGCGDGEEEVDVDYAHSFVVCKKSLVVLPVWRARIGCLSTKDLVLSLSGRAKADIFGRDRYDSR